MSAKSKISAPGKAKAGRAPRATKVETAPEVTATPVVETLVAEPVVEIEPVLTEAAPVAEVAPVQDAVQDTAEIVTEAVVAEPEITTTTTTPPVSRKDKPMSTIPSFDFSVFQTAFSDIQGKAKAALEKSTAAFGDYNAIAKGNVEALVDAGKILTAGLQELGTGAVAEGRTAFETLTSEVKELASAKSPTEFLRLQSELAKKHIDHAVAFGSKQSEAVLKLAGEVAAPVSNRVAVTVEKINKAA